MVSDRLGKQVREFTNDDMNWVALRASSKGPVVFVASEMHREAELEQSARGAVEDLLDGDVEPIE